MNANETVYRPTPASDREPTAPVLPDEIRLRDALCLPDNASAAEVTDALRDLPSAAACDGCRYGYSDGRGHSSCSVYHPAWDIAEDLGLAYAVLDQHGWHWCAEREMTEAELGEGEGGDGAPAGAENIPATEPLTDEMIRALRDEAAAAGDRAQVAACNDALRGSFLSSFSRAQCACAINAARAMDDEMPFVRVVP